MSTHSRKTSIRKYSAPRTGHERAHRHGARESCNSSRFAQSRNRRRAKIPERIARRPEARQWSPDELLTLPEAIALLWAKGPVTVSTLRTAIRHGDLGHARIAGKIFTTRTALEELAACVKRLPGKPAAAAHAGRQPDALADYLAALIRPSTGAGEP